MQGAHSGRKETTGENQFVNSHVIDYDTNSRMLEPDLPLSDTKDLLSVGK